MNSSINFTPLLVFFTNKTQRVTALGFHHSKDTIGKKAMASGVISRRGSHVGLCATDQGREREVMSHRLCS